MQRFIWRHELGEERKNVENPEHNQSEVRQSMLTELHPDQLPLPGAVEVFAFF